MKTYSMPYIPFENVNMLILDKVLLRISSEEEIRRALSRDKKLELIFKNKYKSDLLDSFSDEIIEELSQKISNSFNSFSYLADCYLNTHEKNYRDVIQRLLIIEEDDLFLKNVYKYIIELEYSLDHFITMLRFYKKNDGIGKKLELILGDEMLMKNSIANVGNLKTNKKVDGIRLEINKLINQLVDSNDEVEEIKLLLSKKEAELASTIKSHERKQKTQEKKITKLVDDNEVLKQERLELNKHCKELNIELKELEKSNFSLQGKNDLLMHENEQYKQNLDREKKRAQQQLVTEKERLTTNFIQKLEGKNEEVSELSLQLKEMKEQLNQMKKELAGKSTEIVVTPAENRLTAVGLNAQDKIVEDESDDFISLFDIEENRPSI